MKRGFRYCFAAACLLCFLIPGNAYTQTKSIEKNALLAAINAAAEHSSPIIYVGKIPAYKSSQDRLTKKITDGKFNDFAKDSILEDPLTGKVTMYGHSINSLILSQNEKGYIIQKLSEETIWQRNLFDSSIRVDDLRQGLKTSRQQRRGSGYRYVFTFTKPIFIRDNTICLITLAAMCGGGCGHVDTSFYKFNGHDWEKWITISGSDF